jgi:outer membrane protein assembly factor BamB
VVALACAAVLTGSLGRCADVARAAVPAWTTYRHDASRSGIDPESTSPLPPAPAWQTAPLDGNIYGEPLEYGPRVYVATENDSIYSLDAVTGGVVWEKHLARPVNSSQLKCGDISPTVGITSTPVIDPVTKTIYAVMDTWDGSHAETIKHELVALDIETGAMRAGFPRPVDPPFPTGGNAAHQLQRAGLALDGSEVLIGYGGNDGDCGTYWGWLVGAPESGAGGLLSYQVDSIPGDFQGAIWGAGNAPAVASNGDVYVSTGNGSSSTYDEGDAVLKLNASLELLESWAPADWKELDESDTDLGSSDPVPLPDGLLFQIGKQGIGFLLRADALGGAGTTPLAELHVCDGSWGGGVYVPASASGGTLYITCAEGLRAVSVLEVGGAKPSLSLAAGWTVLSEAVGPPIYAGGLVWVASSATAKLYGLSPVTGAIDFESILGSVEHFATPSAAAGRLFVAGGKQVSSFTIAQAPPTIQLAGGSAQPPPRGAAPQLSGLHQSHAVWREGRAAVRIARVTRSSRRRVPTGTTFSFSLNEGAVVSLRFARRLPGRNVGGRCVPVSRRDARKRRCGRTLTAGVLSFTGHVGRNSIVFQGRLSRSKKLAAAAYLLSVTAATQVGASAPAWLRFTIVA